jgi:hypothetical protein
VVVALVGLDPARVIVRMRHKDHLRQNTNFHQQFIRVIYTILTSKRNRVPNVYIIITLIYWQEQNADSRQAVNTKQNIIKCK